ncbi:MAG: preprotein translocase subunit SecE [Desulfovibrionaceae bacterium]|nr:preprotein translocase subunit SecE [Desulfovibrionaceae bacterium]
MSKKQGTDTAVTAPEAKATAPAPKAARRDASPSGSGEAEGGLGARIREFRDYLALSRVELRKVSWPNWKETRATSLVVFGFVAVMAVLLGVVDLVLSGLIRFILS